MTDEFTSNNNITYYTRHETTNSVSQISNPRAPMENSQPSYTTKAGTYPATIPLSPAPPAHHTHSSNSVVQHSTITAAPSSEHILLQQIAEVIRIGYQQMRISLEAKMDTCFQQIGNKSDTYTQQIGNKIDAHTQQIGNMIDSIGETMDRVNTEIKSEIQSVGAEIKVRFKSTDHQNEILTHNTKSNDESLKPANIDPFPNKINMKTQPQTETQTEVNPALGTLNSNTETLLQPSTNSNTSDITGNTTDNRDDDQMDIDERIMPEREHNETEPLIQGMTTAIALGCNTDSNWRNPREKPTMKNEAYAKKTKPKKKLKKRNRAYKIRIKSLRKIKRENVNVNIIYPKNMKKRALLYSPKCQPHTPSCFLSPPVPP